LVSSPGYTSPHVPGYISPACSCPGCDSPDHTGGS